MGEKLKEILSRHKVLGVDTSLLIYHFEDIAPYSELTEVLFSAAGRGEVELVLSTLCVVEFLVKPWEKGEERVREALRLVLGIPNARYVPPGVEVAIEASLLRARYGLRIPDAVLLATAKEEGATAFLTNDRAFLRVQDEVEVFVLDDLFGHQ